MRKRNFHQRYESPEARTPPVNAEQPEMWGRHYELKIHTENTPTLHCWTARGVRAAPLSPWTEKCIHEYTWHNFRHPHHHSTASDESCPTTFTLSPPELKHTLIQTHKHTIQDGWKLNVKARVQIKPTQARNSEAAYVILASQTANTHTSTHKWSHTVSDIWMHNKTGAKTEKRRRPQTTATRLSLSSATGASVVCKFWQHLPWNFSGIFPLTSPAKFLDELVNDLRYSRRGDQPERRTWEAKLWVNTGALCSFTIPEFKLC